MIKENTLIYRAQTGDEEAFADLMRAYHAFVYTIVIDITNNPHDAEEVVQDTFLNAYQGLKQLTLLDYRLFVGFGWGFESIDFWEELVLIWELRFSRRFPMLFLAV